MSKLHKKTVIVGLIMAITLSIATLLTFGFNIKQKTVNAAFVAETAQSKDDSLCMGWVPEGKTLAKPMSDSNPSINLTNGTGFTWEQASGSFSKGYILGGTKITGSTSDNINYTLKFDHTDNTSDGSVTIKPEPGYRISTLEFGNGDNQSVKTFTFKYDNEYDSTINNVQDYQETTPEILDPFYTGTLTFKATCVPIKYELGLYYSTNENASFSKFANSGYDISNPINLSLDQNKPNITSEEITFSSWVLNADMLTNAGYGVIVDSTNKKLNITKTGVKINLIVSYSDSISGTLDGDTYYEIVSVQGYGCIDQNSTNPIIRAKWAHKYDATIQNNSYGWASQSYRNAKLDGNTIGTFYGGIYYNLANGEQGSSSEKSIEIANAEGYNYSFASNVGKEFAVGSTAPSHEAKKKNSTDVVSSFSVYNYGYTITGWKIQFNYNNANYYLLYNGTTWTKSQGEATQIGINNLTQGATTAGVANLIDNIMPAGFTKTQLQSFGLTLIPQWSPVKINLNYNGNTKEVTYGADYVNINNELGASNIGQSVMYFTTAENGAGDTVALDGVWNYTNLTYGSGYSLQVYPYFVDDIYKVALQDVVADNGRYKLISSMTDYMFNNLKFGENNYKFNTYQESGVYEYKTYSNWTSNSVDKLLIQNYVNDLQVYKANYENGIKGSFSILRKVYTNGRVDNVTSTSSTMYMYLANNQNTGKLPIFERTYYNHIFWLNSYPENVDPKYGYPTQEYLSDVENLKGYQDDPTIRVMEYHDKSTAGKNVYKPGTFTNIWRYSDGYSSSNTCEFQSYYFRKYTFIDVKTILNNKTDDIAQYGYAIIDTIDTIETGNNNKSSTCLVVFNKDKGVNGEMEIYACSALSQIKDDLIVDEIRLYAGCTLSITAYDQSKNPTAMQAGNYDDMIGYKYTSMSATQSENKQFSWTTPGSTDLYVKSIGATLIDDNKYTCGSTITIYVNFDYIVYNMNVVLVNGSKAGAFTVKEVNNITYTTLNISGITKGESYTIEYLANSGYTLTNDAFVIGNKVLENVQGDEQKCYIEINGSWLRTYFYDQIYNSNKNNYDLTNVTITTININTEIIMFGFGLKLYNSKNEYIGEFDIDANGDETGVKFNLDGNGQYRTMPLSSLTQVKMLEDDKGNFVTYYIEYENKKYALIANYWHINGVEIPSEKLKLDSFDFLLKDSTILNEKYLIESNELSIMTGVGKGGIIPEANRKIFMTLILEEIVEYRVKIEGLLNRGTLAVVTTFKNGTNNIRVFQDNMATAYPIYTYDGLTNYVTLSYDKTLYSGVKYTLNGLTDGKTYSQGFNFVNGILNPTLVIEYQEKLLNETVTYKLDGVVATKDEIISGGYLDRDYLMFHKKDDDSTGNMGGQSGLKVDDSVCYIGYVADSDYQIKLYVNGDLAEQQPSSQYYGYVYYITVEDLNKGELNIVVDVVKRDNSKIEFKYLLLNESEKCDDDDFGLIKANVQKSAQSAGSVTEGKTVTVTAVEGNIVTLDISGIATGYTFRAIQHNGDSKQMVTPVNNTITITTSYDPGDGNGNYGDSGIYYIYLVKDEIKAELSLSNSSLSNKYDAYWLEDGDRKSTATHNLVKLSNLHVGKLVELHDVEQKSEKLKCFFYTKQDGTKVYLTEDGTATGKTLQSFKITSKMIDECGTTIQLGIEKYNKFKLDVTLSGIVYIEERTFLTEDGSSYESGTYLLEGSKVYLSVKPYDYNDTTFTGKYDVSISGSCTLTSDFVKDLEIVLDADKSIKIAVTRKMYNVIANDYIYTTLEKLLNNTPDKIDVDHVNTPQLELKPYGSIVTTVVNVPTTNDKELRTILLSGNENTDNIAIFVKDGNVYSVMKWTRSGNTLTYTDIEDGKTLNDYGYTVKFKTISGVSKLEISYKILADINIDCCYVAYKTISAELN